MSISDIIRMLKWAKYEKIGDLPTKEIETMYKSTHFKCKCCGKVIDTVKSQIEPKLQIANICPICNSWNDIIERNKDENCFVADGIYYAIEEEDSPTELKGFYGNKATIVFFDGRKVESSNIWWIGAIPDNFKKKLPNNAKIFWH